MHYHLRDYSSTQGFDDLNVNVALAVVAITTDKRLVICVTSPGGARCQAVVLWPCINK